MSNQLEQLITESLDEPDPVLCNFKITRCHYLLGKELERVIGGDSGANFHSWAVWGSRKAGVTIRQEDKDQAGRDATIVAGIVGLIVGVIVGYFWSNFSTHALTASIATWSFIGLVCGGFCGYQLALYTRRAASALILEGNKIVLDDIGRVTARYLQHVDRNPDAPIDDFLGELRPGPTEEKGQGLLAKAFANYDSARRSDDQKTRHEACYFANCLAILHEHIRLQPLISASLPFLIKKCVTERLMTYSVGREQLAVHEDVPPLDDVVFPPTLEKLQHQELLEFLEGADGWGVGRNDLKNTAACDWTILRQRMGYVVNLFRSRHLSGEVTASPYCDQQFDAIANDRLPERPW